MIKYNKILLAMLLIALTFTASQLKAQSNEEIEKLYIGKWVNVEEKSDTLTIEKLKTGYLVMHKYNSLGDRSEVLLSYISNGCLFIKYNMFNLPCLIDNENQLLLDNENSLSPKKFKKVK